MGAQEGKPVVGITTCSKLSDYVRSVERAGGLARVLEVGESPRRIIGEIDALLLTGGGDVDPVFYGEERHPTIHDAEPGRDEFELDLARRAMSVDLPVLAICRGAQVLNVAAGGSLVQDIPSSVGPAIQHTLNTPSNAIAHEVSVVPGSRLQQALGSAVDSTHLCRVNSRHHQTVARLGAGLVATASAPDGVIEAVEKPDATFCIGVQWHPENFCATGEFATLFRALISAATSGSRNAEPDDEPS